MKINRSFLVLLVCLGAVGLHAQVLMVEDFEYATEDDLLWAWWPSTSGATVSLSTDVAPTASGFSCMRVDFDFASIAWSTEIVTGPDLDPPISIAPQQYVSMRLRGDPRFTAADFRNLYLYVYDINEDFVRWPTAVPLSDDWQIVNFEGGAWEVPWDGSGNIDMNNIIRFAFFQYGSMAAIPPYQASILVDEISIRDEPLTEFPPPSAPREVIDDFEGYADDAALRAFYSYQNSWHPSVTLASLETPAPQGNRALRLNIDFAQGQYPWGSVRSAVVAPFSLPQDAVISFRFKGDPSLAEIADGGTSFWLSFYDGAGHGIDYISAADLVTSSDWTDVQISMADFGDTSTVDVGNLVQWRILVQAQTADQPARAGVFHVDNIRVGTPATEPPTLDLVLENGSLKVLMADLVPGTRYELNQSADLAGWSLVTLIDAVSDTAQYTIQPLAGAAFYQLVTATP